tara:strand:- start:513 stop:692 length:180 start_codon:yes stop_codon:yes gene_type:complete
MSENYEISNKILSNEGHSNEALEEVNQLQEGFSLPVGPLPDPWQFRVYLDTLTVSKNDV